MKRCSKCKRERTLSSFWKSSKQRDGYQSYCKDCSSRRRVQYFQNNKARESELRNAQSSAYRDWYLSLKDGRCVDCNGSFHPVAMQWHHVPGTEKLYDVGHMASRRMRKKTVLEEIAKCVLLCANCHAVRTWANNGA